MKSKLGPLGQDSLLAAVGFTGLISRLIKWLPKSDFEFPHEMTIVEPQLQATQPEKEM